MNNNQNTYSLLDSGNGAKLERVGPYLLNRPAAQAVWPASLGKDEWSKADAEFTRDSSGSGSWNTKGNLPDSWMVEHHGLSFRITPTGFGHLGVFPEHASNWKWLEQQVRNSRKPLNILNLFAYTGGATLALARAGARVCHLDASKGVVSWARENAALSNLGDRPVRWIVEDAAKFLKREMRRESVYDGVLLDPPSFGRGAKGEVFKIERDLPELLELTRGVLNEQPKFVVLSCHSPGFTPLVLKNCLDAGLGELNGKSEAEELTIVDAFERALPSGATARWIANS